MKGKASSTWKFHEKVYGANFPYQDFAPKFTCEFYDPDHWADWWRVRTVDGRELGRRVLLHSHVDEQPFTRDERIRIPHDVRAVVVEAHDKVHGLGGATVTVDLSKPSGPNFRRQAR